MKKVISVILMLAMCFALTGCSSGGGSKETVKETETIEKIETETVLETEENEKTEYNVGEPFEIETEWGNYIVTITGISETDWWERAYGNNDSKVILIEYEVENIDFSNSVAAGVVIDDTCFKIVDDEKYLLSSFSMRYDDINSMDITEPGYKRTSSIPYISERDSEYYDVIFTRKSMDVAKVRINM